MMFCAFIYPFYVQLTPFSMRMLAAECNKKQATFCDLSCLFCVVELQGLEPWTSSMPWKRSSQLSYSPTNKGKFNKSREKLKDTFAASQDGGYQYGHNSEAHNQAIRPWFVLIR